MTKWKIDFKPSAFKELKKLDHKAQKDILAFLDKITHEPSPRTIGAPLKGTLKSFWRYRVGNYRIICDVDDQEIVILILHVGHRKDIYKNALHQ